MARPRSPYGEWASPEDFVVGSISQLSPAVLAEIRTHLESIDALRVREQNIIGHEDFIERVEVESGSFTGPTDGLEFGVFNYRIPGGMLQTEGAILVIFGGRMLNNDGAPRGLTVKLLYDDTVVYEDTVTVGTNANERGFQMWFVFGNAGATNAQKLSGIIVVGGPFAPTTGYGGMASMGLAFGGPFGGTAAEDSKTTKLLELKMQLSAASANLTFTREHVHVSRIAH